MGSLCFPGSETKRQRETQILDVGSEAAGSDGWDGGRCRAAQMRSHGLGSTQGSGGIDVAGWAGKRHQAWHKTA